jgi:SAM-dependent methyltransferase
MQKTNPCILCDNLEFHIIHQKDQWQYLCCRHCKLVSIHPRPTPRMLMEYYRDYLPDRAEGIRKWEALIQPVVTESADLVVSRTRTGGKKLLDVGCGYGFLLNEMKSRGWDVKGLEVSKTGRDYAQSRWNFKVYSEPLENLELPENIFDIVSILYVIEHVYDPLALLMEVNRVLKPGGLVIVRWPHTTPIVRILGPLAQKMDLYHTPYHLYDFSPRTIGMILSKTGFKSVETMIGGHTRPADPLSRWSSMLFGQLSDVLFCLFRGKILLPGISKTTVAFK